MRIYVERENHREGIWMELPASREEAEQVRKELEKRHPSVMMPFVAEVESRFPEIEKGLSGELVFQGDNLETFNRLAGSLDALSQEEGLLFQAAYQMEAPQSADQILKTLGHLDSYSLHPEIRSLEELGRYLKRGETEQLPEELDRFVDYQKIGRLWQEDYGILTEGGFVEKRKEPEVQTGAEKQKAEKGEKRQAIFAITLIRDSFQDRYVRFTLPLLEEELAEKKRQAGIREETPERVEISGTVDGLLEHLPPCSTLEELNQAATVIKELEACSIIDWKLAFAALEAELPGTMEECCHVIREHKTYELLPFPFLEPESYAHYHLEQAGLSVPEGLSSCFDYRRYGQEKIAEDGVTETFYGVLINRKKPICPDHGEGQEMKLYSPLTLTTCAGYPFFPALLHGEKVPAWGEWQDQILLTYCSKAPFLPPLSSQKQLKSIKNMVITEALKLGGHHFLYETSMHEDDHTEIRLDELEETILNEMEEEEAGAVPADTEDRSVVINAEDPLPELEMPFYEEGENGSAKAEWNKRYKLARSYLYGSERIPQDFAEAMRLFLLEADSGNALAMYDLGRMWADGLGVEVDPDTAQEWYRKALAAFLSAEKDLPERKKTYLQYRIGKMYLVGLGCTQDCKTAADWLERAAGKQHKYAQYSLAGLYARGQGVEKDPEHAFTLYQASAAQDNPYASYELGKMFQSGTGTEKSEGQAKAHFQNAFSGFLVLEKQSHDDKLQYRLGQMLHQGIGTEKDEEEAVRYWQLAAKLGNVNAQYALGKFWLDTGTGDIRQAVEWLEKAADAGNASAQYASAKIYLEGRLGERDTEKAVELLQKAAEQGNGYAAYRFGRLYLEGGDVAKDAEKAVHWLTEAADQDLPFAQYTLGCLYLKGEEVSKDMEKAVMLLRQSTLQGNEYAQYRLGSVYLLGVDVPQNLKEAVRWLEMSADKGNQYAQYALGKFYLCGQPGVPRDKEKAVPLLEASAAQGNIYAQFLLEHMDSFRDPDVVLAATRLMHHLSRIFQEDYRKTSGGSGMGHMDRKRRRKLQKKRMAQGHKTDDHEPQQTM